MRRGNIVVIPKKPEVGECVVFDVMYSAQGEAMCHLCTRKGWRMFWTRASNCEKILDSTLQ